ncbi:MAG: right-handed parallel beta-helix repeat-containing protein [Deltaproteobacteria bacterium]|nr:right-handed parallel beta-helix repeat-containing protein [Deltaproteobacteria bacterium]
MRLTLLSLPLGLALAACGDDASDTGCDVRLTPGANDAQAIQAAFIDARSGDTICLAPGTYTLDRELSLSNAADITLRGDGATRDEVVLDFATQTVGDDGVVVTAPGFTIENLWVKNAPGNGVVAHAEDSTFRNIKVSWDAGSVTENGFYAVYPTDCKRTIIEDTEITGASDAGIYVGSCEYAIVRRNKVYGNVAGIEIENSRYADVYDNEVYDNTAGILVFVLPKLAIKETRHVLVRDNVIRANNHANFATDGTVVSYVPFGLGALVLAGSDIEFRNNTFEDNQGTAILAVSYRTFELLTDTTLDDPEMDAYLRRLYIHSNTYDNNGYQPLGALALMGQASLENVLWDGVLEGEVSKADTKICLGASPTTFRNFAVADGFSPDKQSTDTADHTCTLEPVAEMEDFDGVSP